MAIDLFSHKVECFNVDSSHSLLKVTDISWEKQPKYQLSFLAVYIKSALRTKKSCWLLNCTSDVIHDDPSACITPLSKTGRFTINTVCQKKKKEKKTDTENGKLPEICISLWLFIFWTFRYILFLWILKCLHYAGYFYKKNHILIQRILELP